MMQKVLMLHSILSIFLVTWSVMIQSVAASNYYMTMKSRVLSRVLQLNSTDLTVYTIDLKDYWSDIFCARKGQ
jgi:hypothetical protein